MPESGRGYVLKRDVIVMERELNDLDIFVKKFLDILKRHSDYLVVSGYVSISTGRTRGTEDIDIIIPVMGKEKFISLYDDLEKSGFWCFQGDNPENLHDYVKNMESLRFALKDEMFPNVELIFFNNTKRRKIYEFEHPQKIRIQDFEFKIPPIEFEILYKEKVLGGKKDMEDAKHLRVFFSDIISDERFDEYRKLMEDE